jgi:O-palmitoleoyl-L-serine hydrolase
VILRYCDGGSYSGNSSATYQDHTLHFQGSAILDTLLHDLLTVRGMASATNAVISGCSAGGLATYLHADRFASVLPSSTKVAAMPDSGFFLDEQRAPEYHSKMRWCFETFNAAGGVNKRCIAAHTATQDTWKCFFAEHVSPYIQTPVFALQSEYDSWQTANVLGSTDAAIINEFGFNITSRLKANLLMQSKNGAFLDSCHHHCGKWGDINIDGNTQGQAFATWYNALGQNHWVQGEAYPCEPCCSGGQ